MNLFLFHEIMMELYVFFFNKSMLIKVLKGLQEF